jgi:hypothetical protein
MERLKVHKDLFDQNIVIIVQVLLVDLGMRFMYFFALEPARQNPYDQGIHDGETAS